ncbi:SDR family oxidoreductase [Gracilibacillus ureilyticus]|uniref:SDR family oxidoreductase n=1 Tax=Gracilibacillus ureilyticus TaxID=531814 RepID=UPI000B7FEB12|nr:SDR family oxidoreductase [Gracilibacillus ureilyticus]
MKVLITGANRGLGLSLIETGLGKGYTMFAGVRSVADEDIAKLQKLKNEYEGQLRILHIDVTNEKTVRDASKAVAFTDQYVDVIINNAAILNEREKTIEDLDIHATMKAFDINTLGPLRVIKHFLPLIKHSSTYSVEENTAILNISSEAASLTNAYPGDYPYGMSKAALNMFTEKLRAYLREDKIFIASVHPGWMKTDMGGGNAPKDPAKTAKNIWSMIENPPELSDHCAFINDETLLMKI